MIQLRYQHNSYNVIHNQAYHKDSDSKQIKAKEGGGMRRACLDPKLG
jgi:hypothetical protein